LLKFHELAFGAYRPIKKCLHIQEGMQGGAGELHEFLIWRFHGRADVLDVFLKKVVPASFT
jgi:hypothetical protein